MPTVCPWTRHWNCSKSEVSAMISEKIKNQIQVVQGNVTKRDGDCIVNAANRKFAGRDSLEIVEQREKPKIFRKPLDPDAAS